MAIGRDVGRSDEHKKNPGPYSARGVTRLVTDRLSATARLKSMLLEEVPVQNLLTSFPDQNQGTLWTRRDSNPHLVTRRVNVLPITPRALQPTLRASGQVRKVVRHKELCGFPK